MIFSVDVLHYSSIAGILLLPIIGVAIGQARACNAVLKAINRQPESRDQLNKMFFLSLALNETAAIICVLMAFLMIAQTPVSHEQALCRFAMLFACALPSFIIGLLSSIPAIYAFEATERQPFFGSRIMTIMLLLQAMMQTPLIFGLIVSVLAHVQVPCVAHLPDALRLIASGIAIGIGSVGPSIGLALLSKSICTNLGINRVAYPSLRTFTYVSAGLIETPILFSLIIALIISLATTVCADMLLKAIALICAASVMGIATFASGLVSGLVSATTATQFTQKPELFSLLYRMSMLTQTLIDTVPIYGFAVALLFIFMI